MDITFVSRVHSTVKRTVEMMCKFFGIGKSSYNAIWSNSMLVVQYRPVKFFYTSVFGAVFGSIRDEENLLRIELFQSR